MNFDIDRIPKGARQSEVQRALADVIHSEEFVALLPSRVRGEGPINFGLKLTPGESGSLNHNDGTGTLTLPTEIVAVTFSRAVQRREVVVRVGRSKLFFQASRKSPPKWEVATLTRTPYIDPRGAEEREQMNDVLSQSIRVIEIQFGTFFRNHYPGPRSFAIEGRHTFQDTPAQLKFDHDTRSLQVQVHVEDDPGTCRTLVLKYSNIRNIVFGHDFARPYVCLDNLIPAIVEERSLLPAKSRQDRKGCRRLITSLSPIHESVTTYTPHLRIILEDDHLTTFRDLASKVDLRHRLVIATEARSPDNIDGVDKYSAEQLHTIENALRKQPFAVAFQIEALLRRHLLSPGQIFTLIGYVKGLQKVEKRSHEFLDYLLRKYSGALSEDPTHTSDPMKTFKSICRAFTRTFKPRNPNDAEDSKMFECYHVVCTPSRLLLQGPHPTGLNRIIRHYRDFASYHFIRVEFRDEEGDFIRSSFELDTTHVLQHRVGKVLKEGITVAGRHFEFLAYSSSSLKVHSVWFICPFDFVDGDSRSHRRIDAQSIRERIVPHISENRSLFRKTSKYAARVALAFTTSESHDNIRLQRHEWVGDHPDVYPSPSSVVRVQTDEQQGGAEKMIKLAPFSDGVGTVSTQFGEMILEALRWKDRGARARAGNFRPSAFKVRFLGYKGVVVVDPTLDDEPGDVKMRLRPSMKKFDSIEDDPTRQSSTRVEIAEIYAYPIRCYLNRPLVMLFEHLGVPADVFLKLQNEAVADAKTIDASLSQFRRVLRLNNIGRPFDLPFLLTRIEELGLKLEDVDDPFWKALRQTSFNHVMARIRHEARILVPDSYLLVGVMDETCTLCPNEIYACVQGEDDEKPDWITGRCAVTRNPVVHQGDIQPLRAIGEPPAHFPKFFHSLRNVVVFSSQGERSMPSCLAGGDLDGDLYAVIRYEGLQFSGPRDPAPPDSSEDAEFDDPKREVQPSDICDFFTEYMNSDLLGLLSVRLLRMADQSKAVDYPKKGIPVVLTEEDDKFLRPLINHKPDWENDGSAGANDATARYYKSDKALGLLYNNKVFSAMEDTVDEVWPPEGEPLEPYRDSLSIAFKSAADKYLDPCELLPTDLGTLPESHMPGTLRKYTEELQYIKYTHSLSAMPETSLMEVEVVAGLILGQHSLKKKIKGERVSKMQDHISSVVRRVRRELMGLDEEKGLVTLGKAWEAWGYSQVYREQGVRSFGLIALKIMFECLDHLKEASSLV